jgi:hypothetical protein
MAVQTPVRPSVNPAGNPTLNAVGATDTIPVSPGGKYILIVENAGGSIDNMAIVDPTSQAPAGATFTGGSPNVAHAIAATTGKRHIELDANRFRDATGNITVTHSFQTSVTCIVYGPYN